MTDATKLLEEARRLRERGYSYARIARRLGVSESAVYKGLNPDRAREYNRRSNARRNASKREWDRTRGRATCPRCGGPMGAGSRSPSKRREQCWRCWLDQARRRHELIAEGYRRGLAAREIAEQIGVSVHSVHTTASRLRRAGVDVPYAPMGGRSHRRVQS